MGLHISFEYLKHKLWLKKGLGIKLPIWLPTIESLESPWFSFVKVVYHIPVESSQWGLQLFFKLHLNRQSTQKLMGLQSRESLNLGVWGQNDIWVRPLWLILENIIRGKVVTSPKFGPWWILWVCVYSWLVCAPEMLQLYTNQLIVWFV